MADPAPSMDDPRRLVLSLTEDDPKRMNAVLYNVVNIQKFYGMDNVQLAVVAYGPGLKAVLEDSPVAARVRSLLQYDVEFVACGNTMEATGKGEGDLIDGVDWVQAGIPEIVERRLRGWISIKP